MTVDVPTGIDAERGRCASHAVVSDDTLTLLTLKPGLFTASGRDHAGRIWLATLGVVAIVCGLASLYAITLLDEKFVV